MTPYLKYWCDCVVEGWEFFGHIFDFVGILAMVVSSILYLRNREEQKRRWETAIMVILFWTLPVALVGYTSAVATYSKYHEAEEARVKAEKKGPELDGFIDQQIISTSNDSNTIAIMQVSVFNSGDAPSIADDYELKVTLTNHTTVQGDLIDIPDHYCPVKFCSTAISTR